MTVKNKHYVQLGHFEGQMCKRSKQGLYMGRIILEEVKQGHV